MAATGRDGLYLAMQEPAITSRRELVEQQARQERLRPPAAEEGARPGRSPTSFQHQMKAAWRANGHTAKGLPHVFAPSGRNCHFLGRTQRCCENENSVQGWLRGARGLTASHAREARPALQLCGHERGHERTSHAMRSARLSYDVLHARQACDLEKAGWSPLVPSRDSGTPGIVTSMVPRVSRRAAMATFTSFAHWARFLRSVTRAASVVGK